MKYSIPLIAILITVFYSPSISSIENSLHYVADQERNYPDLCIQRIQNAQVCNLYEKNKAGLTPLQLAELKSRADFPCNPEGESPGHIMLFAFKKAVDRQLYEAASEIGASKAKQFLNRQLKSANLNNTV